MIPQETRDQIARLTLAHHKPLIVCDVDEVVVHFLRAFETWLEEHGCWLDPVSFALNGNVKRIDTGAPIATQELAQHFVDFFTARTAEFEEIEGAAHALRELSDVADVVMLTNLPNTYLDARQRNLLGLGMPYPIVVNDGPKGPAMRQITAASAAPVIFIDDAPSNITSVRDTLPEVHVVHFMQDERFGRHCAPIDRISLRSDNWQETADHIARLIEVKGLDQ
ncbi:hypothetical protein FHS85_002862 [Rhodoligotrophos appendicifer]|uniref:hypothetical protein n=1 Tax=Rhodoligotrophos appendicifer TaxID=987056 RepID=UPI0011863F5B|nr:hypothetical protein [Rhodoligotrophos appendicifer]